MYCLTNYFFIIVQQKNSKLTQSSLKELKIYLFYVKINLLNLKILQLFTH